MHSSRMLTACSSSCLGESPPGTPPGTRHPLRAGTNPGPGTPLRPGTPPDQAPPRPDTPKTRHPLDQIPLNFPLACGPGPDPPQFPPWVWAWRTPHPTPETCCKACWDTTCNACWDSSPLVDRHTPVNILPFLKLHLRVVINDFKYGLKTI